QAAPRWVSPDELFKPLDGHVVRRSERVIDILTPLNDNNQERSIARERFPKLRSSAFWFI
ncbi:MAG: hypothetical protein GXP27_03535, partial [Planctomycetes bacterium]|nr:hypothetical protein [Planctomycetota bacterium]